MPRFPGLSPTGRRVRSPTTDLIELQDDSGKLLVALAFRDAYRDAPMLDKGIATIRDFLEMPMIPGVGELKLHPPGTGTFVYPTGRCRSLWELSGCFDDPLGKAAALDLIVKAGKILIDAAEGGHSQGVNSHAGLGPWNILINEKGAVTIIEYGIPQVDIIDFLDDDEYLPKSDRLRYCPPERLEGAAEDRSSIHTGKLRPYARSLPAT